MAQTIKIKRGGIGAIASSAPTTLKGELILATGSFSNGLGTSLFAAEADDTLKLSHGRIDSISDGAALATEIGSNTAFTGLLIHSASDNKLYRYSGTAFVELPIAAGSFVGTLGVGSGGTGLDSVSDGDVLVATAGDTLGTVSLNTNGTILVGGATPAAVTPSTLGGNGITATGTDGSLVLSVDADSETGGNIQAVNVTSNGVGLNVNAIAGTGLEADGSANLRLATQGNGIAGGSTSTLSVQAGNSTITVDTTGVQVTTGSISSGGNNLVDAGTLFTLSSSIASDITSNAGSVAGTAGQVAFFSDGTTVGGDTNFTFDSGTDVLTVNGSTFGSNTTIAGNLTVQGTTTTVNSEILNVSSSIVKVNFGGAVANGGMEVTDATGGTTVTGSLLWNGTSDYWMAGPKASEKRITRVNADMADNNFVIAKGADLIDDVAASTAGDILQWNGTSMVASNVIDGGTF